MRSMGRQGELIHPFGGIARTVHEILRNHGFRVMRDMMKHNNNFGRQSKE